MQALSNRLDNLEQKLRLLLRKMEGLSVENRELKTENNQLKKELQEVRFKNSTDISTPASIGDAKAGELYRIKNELNNYIEEVEQCISILES